MFLWLAHRGRLFTNERRFRRSLSDSDSCPFCSETESTSHLLLHCPTASEVWTVVDSLNFDPADCETIHDLRNPQLTCKTRNTVIMAILWSIWKRRNAKIFKNEVESLGAVLRHAAQEIFFWSSRCANEARKQTLIDWGIMLSRLDVA